MKHRVFSVKCCGLENKYADGPNWSLGINDEEFSQRKPDKGLITKKEIRVLSLYALQLQEK